MKKFLFMMLSSLLAISAIGEAGIKTLKPPALDDVFYLIRYRDGSAEFRENLSDHDLKDLRDKHDIKDITRTNYAQIATSVTQRVYDYHFYFEQYIASDKVNDPEGWEEALDRLMTVFSQDLTVFQAINNFPVEVNSWQAVRDLFVILYDVFFQGYTLHTAPNVRVIPLCKDNEVQVFVSSGQVDYSRINVNAVPPPQVVTDIGYYTFTLRYEPDNVWRFITWTVDNRVQYVDPPLNGAPPPYVPYIEDPKTHCHHHHHHS